MPDGIHEFEEVLDFLDMPPPPVPSREETGNTPFSGWSPTPSYTPTLSQAPTLSQSQASVTSRRRMLPHEELTVVQLAVQHAPIRQAQGHAIFYAQVESSFEDAHGWEFKTVRRKLDTLEVKWRKEFERRGSGTGTENEGDMSQAMEAWIAIRDEEHKRTAERVAANSQARKEREVSSKWRANAVLRVRDRPPVVTRELPPEHDYTDLTSDDEAALMPTQQHDVASTAAATVASTPTRSGGSGSRGRGVTRPSVSRRRNSSSRSRSSTSNLALLLQLEERRQAREEAAEERRERREAATREMFMAQMNTLI